MIPENRLLPAVDALIRETADTEIVPKFRALPASEIEQKSSGEIVTSVDRAVEIQLSIGLKKILPGSLAIGEEAVSAEPSLLDRFTAEQPVWLIDPLDGTENFTKGDPHFGVMIALVIGGKTQFSWIYHPVSKSMIFAHLGHGGYVNGAPICMPDVPVDDKLRGSILSRFLPEALKSDALVSAPAYGAVSATLSAAHEYPNIARGDMHFALYYRTLPWDHLAGVLLIEECGGVARRFDGGRFDPLDRRPGLLVAANQQIWNTVRRRSLPSLGPTLHDN